ncbi:hypothetical protein AB3331_09380 [Streptococcus sp. H49]|uniref:hypothetical protein n=1 Tax=Streptococcus huangxiaojuni TaxID=3237239 RepID=UPI0034A4B16A
MIVFSNKEKYIEYLETQFVGKSKVEIKEIFEKTLYVPDDTAAIFAELDDLRSFVAALLLEYGIKLNELTVPIGYYVGGVFVERLVDEIFDAPKGETYLTRAFFNYNRTRVLARIALIYFEDIRYCKEMIE